MEITEPAGSGKTTQMLEKLIRDGGGIFITQNLREIAAISMKINLDDPSSKVQVIEVPRNTNIIIDDVEGINLVTVRTVRKQ